jgi:hypothetical protein
MMKRASIKISESTDAIDAPMAMTLWTLHQGARVVSAEAYRIDGHHWQLRLLSEGVVFAWRWFPIRDLAEDYGHILHDEFEQDGWVNRVAPHGH